MNVDFGMRFEGFCSDLQRTWYCLRPGETEPPAAVQSAASRRCATPIRKAGEFLRPGVQGHEVDAVARGHIVAPGFDEYPHALGHQIGRYAHDGAGLLCPRLGALRRQAVRRRRGGAVLHPRAARPGARATASPPWRRSSWSPRDGCRYLSEPQTEIMLVRKRPRLRRAAAEEVHMKLQMAVGGAALAFLAAVTSGQELPERRDQDVRRRPEDHVRRPRDAHVRLRRQGHPRRPVRRSWRTTRSCRRPTSS